MIMSVSLAARSEKRDEQNKLVLLAILAARMTVRFTNELQGLLYEIKPCNLQPAKKTKPEIMTTDLRKRER